MAATSGKFYGVGARSGRIYKLDANAVPDAPDTNPYMGIEFLGLKGLDANIPDARKIAVLGDDRVQTQITLPRTEVSTSTIKASGIDFSLVAALANVKAFTVGEAAGISYGTDKQGSEADIAILINQYGKDAVSKLSRYRVEIYPVVNGILNPASMNDNANEISMQVTPQAVSRFPWGLALSEATHGCTMAEIFGFMCETPGLMVAWKGDGNETDFSFDADHQPASTSKINVVVTVATDGTATDVTSTVTKAVDKLTFAVAPADGTKIIAFIEEAL